MAETITPKEYIAGAQIDSEGNIDTSKAAVMYSDAELAAKAEQKRNAETVRNLQEVFGKMDLGPDDMHLSLMFQEQSPLIVKYLKDTTKKGEEGDEIYKDIAPGIAMIGYEMATYGFGSSEIDSGDEVFDKEIEATVKKRYKAAETLFNQLLDKIYGSESEGVNGVLLGGLEMSFSLENRGNFNIIKDRFKQLLDQGLPNDDRGILEYQENIDSLINYVGYELGEAAENDAKSSLAQEDADREDYRLDMLTMAETLRRLQNLRKASVRHKFMSRAYDNMSPIDIKKSENAERKAQQKIDTLREEIYHIDDDTEEYTDTPLSSSEIETDEDAIKKARQEVGKEIVRLRDTLQNSFLLGKRYNSLSNEQLTKLAAELKKVWGAYIGDKRPRFEKGDEYTKQVKDVLQKFS